MTFPIQTAAAAASFVAPSFAEIDLTDGGKNSEATAELTLSGENGRWYAAGVNVTSTAAAPSGPTATGAAGSRPTPPAVRLHTPAATLAPQDELTLSSDLDAVGVDQAPPADALRQARLDQIQAAIADGSYDTDERMDAAIDRLLGSLG